MDWRFVHDAEMQDFSSLPIVFCPLRHFAQLRGLIFLLSKSPWPINLSDPDKQLPGHDCGSPPLPQPNHSRTKSKFFPMAVWLPACVWSRGDIAQKWRHFARPLEMSRSELINRP